MQCILKGRKYLPKGIFASEDLPEEWKDRRRILKPIFNAAKRNESLKSGTHLTKDELIINKKVITAGPNSNLSDVANIIDPSSICQRTDGDNKTLLFLGSLSPFSNLYQSKFCINNVKYSRVEQYLQSEKAALFDDDATHYKIMKESNRYKIKQLGATVRNFSLDVWHHEDKRLALNAVHAKFSQNQALKQLLLETGNQLIAEGSGNSHWGIGLHIHDCNALDKRHWKNNGGLMSEILGKVRKELS